MFLLVGRLPAATSPLEASPVTIYHSLVGVMLASISIIHGARLCEMTSSHSSESSTQWVVILSNRDPLCAFCLLALVLPKIRTNCSPANGPAHV